MNIFNTSCTIENHVDLSKSVRIRKLLVDTGSEYTWIQTARLEKIGVKREKKTFGL